MNKQTVLDAIRVECRDVAQHARNVRLAESRIHGFVAPLLTRPLSVPALDTTFHFIGDVETTCAFFAALAAVNFGSGYFPLLRKREGMSGYFTIASGLKERFEARGPITAAELAEVTADDCAQIFGQQDVDPAIDELMGLFAQSWNDLGGDLVARFGGTFSNLIESAQHRACRLVETLAHQPLFRDVSQYRGTQVSFYKRSQLLASDLSLALDGRGLGRFDDLDQLTIFADNLVPHVLRLEGILEYAPALMAKIEAEQLIPAGSDEEIEIRACAVHAVELMVEAAADAGVSWTARDVDQLLWHRGQDPRCKAAAKRHRTRTVYY